MIRLETIAHPILDGATTKEFESALFHGEADAEWAAMCAAGEAVGAGILKDFRELGAWPSAARLLVLAGKGHNGGDALLAAKHILQQDTTTVADVLFLFPQQHSRPLVQRAHRELVQCGAGRVNFLREDSTWAASYTASIDGVFGFQFRPPLPARLGELFRRVEAAKIQLRAAVDLPSGLGDPASLGADFTYATGVVKNLLFQPENRRRAGRIRYLDLGFFDGAAAVPAADDRVLSVRSLAALRAWRDPLSDKRDYGHLFVVGGSRSYPGAVLMTVRAALRSGVGLLTAFVPESLAPTYAAAVPEAMWVGCPETPAGGLALEGLHLFREREKRADAVVIGPGLTREPESLALAKEILQLTERPAVVDADALQPEVVLGSPPSFPRILTPHAGEYARLAGGLDLLAFARKHSCITVLKGAPSRITDGWSVYYSLAGGPVLARGGSGDILAGMIGGLLAQNPPNALAAACAGTLWHGLAADCLARERGSVAVNTTELLDFLGHVLRNEVVG